MNRDPSSWFKTDRKVDLSPSLNWKRTSKLFLPSLHSLTNFQRIDVQRSLIPRQPNANRVIRLPATRNQPIVLPRLFRGEQDSRLDWLIFCRQMGIDPIEDHGVTAIVPSTVSGACATALLQEQYLSLLWRLACGRRGGGGGIRASFSLFLFAFNVVVHRAGHLAFRATALLQVAWTAAARPSSHALAGPSTLARQHRVVAWRRLGKAAEERQHPRDRRLAQADMEIWL